MANFNYRRFFIILRAKDTGFELQEKEPSGYCKIDIKNNRIKFFIYVQDLKPRTEQQGVYEAYIVSPREEKPAKKLADISVDSRGRAECTVESDTDALNRTAKSIEELSAIAVVYRSLSDTAKLYYPLVGSAGKRGEIDWSGRIMADILKTSKTLLSEKQIPNQNETPSEENKDKEIFEIVTNQTTFGYASDDLALDLGARHEKNFFEEESDFLDKIVDEKYPFLDSVAAEKSDLSDEVACETSLTSEGEVFKEIILEKNGIHDKIALEDDENPDDKIDKAECSPLPSANYWDVMRDYFMKLTKENPRAYPFGHNDDRRWVKIEHIPDGYSQYCNQRTNMDYCVGDSLRRDTESRTHYLVGLVGQDETVSYVIYGFPGFSYEQPPAYAIHGLSVWEPLKNGYGKGYWLIYIDAQTGDLVQQP